MSWISTRPRLEQVYVFVTHKLNACGIRPDNAVIKSWIVEELHTIAPQPTKFECEMVLVGMLSEKVKFYGDPDSADRFASEPLFDGTRLGKLK